jgi:hypothetical protein
MTKRTDIDLFTPPEELERQRAIRELLRACRAQLRRCRSKSERKDIMSTIKGYEWQLLPANAPPQTT